LGEENWKVRVRREICNKNDI